MKRVALDNDFRDLGLWLHGGVGADSGQGQVFLLEKIKELGRGSGAESAYLVLRTKSSVFKAPEMA